MIQLGTSIEAYLILGPTDLRKSFQGLSDIVASHDRKLSKGGSLYVFSNRLRNRIKILSFDGTGLWVSAKRLEEGNFSWPREAEHPELEILPLRGEALVPLLDGVDLRGAKLRPWYERSS